MRLCVRCAEKSNEIAEEGIKFPVFLFKVLQNLSSTAHETGGVGERIH